MSLRAGKILDLQGKWRKEKKKPLAKKASIAPANSLTYALHGYKVVIESQQDAKLLQTARGGVGKTKVKGQRVWVTKSVVHNITHLKDPLWQWNGHSRGTFTGYDAQRGPTEARSPQRSAQKCWD